MCINLWLYYLWIRKNARGRKRSTNKTPCYLLLKLKIFPNSCKVGNSVFTRVLLKEYCGNLALFSPSVFWTLLYFLMMVGDSDPLTWWRIEEDLLIRDVNKSGSECWARVYVLCTRETKKSLYIIMFAVYADWMICIHCLVWWINTTDVPGDQPRLTIDIVAILLISLRCKIKGFILLHAEYVST